ncbi:MFS transporter [Pandoraea pnomenusa]|uniref:MFS transporter n=1 Tax=Pandoraea pnomenusa TaxID=93220 RepID=UPI0007BCC73A|nr:MFS transporter [Pandoraea pnomenusa]ANC47667.1 MFS transporter [Pandoraea pnomenusa]
MRTINLASLTAEAKFNRFHLSILLWCALIIVMDGYDLAVAGIALPSIMQAMSIEPAHAGLMVSSALFGMLFGNLLFGTLGERIGRPKAIAICVFLFSAFTAAAGLTNDPKTFALARFVAGLGIGGVMPNVIAQMTEYSPKRMRAMLVALMFSGYCVGGVLAAVLGKSLIEVHGWQSVFLLAAAPIVLIPFILRSMPESVPFLIRRKDARALQQLAAKIDPTYTPHQDDTFVGIGAEQAGANAPVRQLFQDGRTPSTVLFWLSCVMCLFMVYALSSWLTKLMASAGYSIGSALTFVIVMNLGGIFGAIAGGWLADRLHIKYVLAGMYLIAAGSLAMLGQEVSTSLRYVLIGLAGGTTIGTQIVGCAYVGQFYPNTIRATGLGWFLGVGRVGAIVAPIVIGVLVGAELPLGLNFVAIGIPGLLAAILIFCIDHAKSASNEKEAAKESRATGRPAAGVVLGRDS